MAGEREESMYELIHAPCARDCLLYPPDFISRLLMKLVVPTRRWFINETYSCDTLFPSSIIHCPLHSTVRGFTTKHTDT